MLDETIEWNVARDEEHVVHQRREVGLGDLRRLLHRARGEADLAAPDRASVRQFATHPRALDRITVVDGHGGMGARKMTHLGSGAAGFLQLRRQRFDSRFI